MKKSGFSMIELVFVIVILGVLAAVAVPRFVATRTDAQVAMARSDIASTLKAIPAAVFAENIDVSQSSYIPANGGAQQDWADWMMDVAGLDKGRWDKYSSTTGRGIVPKNTSGSAQGGGTAAICGSEPLIWINHKEGNLYFDPDKLDSGGAGQHKAFCEGLKASYPSGSNRIIPLSTSGKLSF